MMEKRKLSFGQKFNIASGQFGTMLGAGVCSGATVRVMFVDKGGWMSPIVALASLVLLFAFYYLALKMARTCKINEYPVFFDNVYGKYRKFFTPISDVLILINLLGSAAIAFAGCGSYLTQIFGTPLFIGILLTALICVVIGFKGINFFNRVQGIMCYVMFAILLGVYAITIFGYGWGDLVDKFTVHWLPDNYSTGTMIYWALIFLGTYFNMVSVYIINADKFNNNKDILHTMGIGFTTNAAAIILPTIALLAFAPACMAFELPTLYLMTDVIKFPPAEIIYSILLIFAFLTTGAGCIVTLTTRVRQLIPEKNRETSVAKIGVPTGIVVAAILFSLVGLTTIISSISPYTATASIIIIGIPVLLIAPKKIRAAQIANKS